MLARTSAVVLLGAVVGVGLIRPGIPSPEPTVSSFLLAWEAKNYLGAAKLTTGPPQQVAAALAGAYQRLDATDEYLIMRNISQRGKQASATFAASIDLGGSGLTWKYPGGFNLKDTKAGWRVIWNPSVIVPGMTGSEQLAVVSSLHSRAQLLDSDGHPLMVKSPGYEVGVLPRQVSDPDKTAAMLGAATGVSPGQIEGQILSAVQDDFLGLATLSPAEHTALAAKLAGIPGVIIRPESVRLFSSIAPDVVGQVGTEIASVLRTDGVQYRPGTTVGLSGLEQTYQRQLIGTPQTEVILQGTGGQAEVELKSWGGTWGVPVHTTLNSGVQRAADDALAGIAGSAAIVAVQASSGQVLAVASQDGRGRPALSPLDGGYQPGQAFTVVSAAAALSKGANPDSPIPCYQHNESVTNDPPEHFVGPGATFRRDFASQCSTAFAGLAGYLSPEILASTANGFGIGGWALPLGSYAGEVGPLTAGNKMAAAMAGGNDVRVSPLGMALAAAVVDSGTWHTPSLVSGQADLSSATRRPMSPQVLSELRDLMQQAASHGQNKVADVGGDVFAQSGTAPYGSGGLELNWFVGYQGNVAFAVVQLGKSAAGSAAPLAASFLHNVQAGS